MQVRVKRVRGFEFLPLELSRQPGWRFQQTRRDERYTSTAPHHTCLFHTANFKLWIITFIMSHLAWSSFTYTNFRSLTLNHVLRTYVFAAIEQALSRRKHRTGQRLFSSRWFVKCIVNHLYLPCQPQRNSECCTWKAYVDHHEMRRRTMAPTPSQHHLRSSTRLYCLSSTIRNMKSHYLSNRVFNLFAPLKNKWGKT